MSFQILDQYKIQFPNHITQIDEFYLNYNKKLWHQLSVGILKFIFHNDVKGKLSFNFYLQFIKKFDRNIDQINHLKILKQCLTNVTAQNAIIFLQNFQEKDTFSDQAKAIVAGLRANYYVGINAEKSSELYHRLEKFIKERRDIDSFAFSTYYRFALNYFQSKNKQKAYYQNALQYLAYTSAEQIEQKTKIDLLANMGIAILTSPQIFNFSQLLEQKMLKSLCDSEYKWVYQLMYIFNQGDITTYNKVIDRAIQKNIKLKQNRQLIDQKIRLMSFLQLAFNLQKNNRVIKFNKLSSICQIPEKHVQFMIMKAAALKLVKVQIDQINQQVIIKWIAPKVLNNQRIQIMLKKFQQWQKGTTQVQEYIKENWKFKD